MREKRKRAPFPGGVPKRPKIVLFAGLLVLLILGYLGLLFVFISGTTKSFEKVSEEMAESLADSELEEQTASQFRRWYDLTPTEYEGVLYYHAGGNTSVEEVLVLCVKEESQIEEVHRAIEDHLADRKADFTDSKARQVQLLEGAVYVVRGNYVFLAVGEDTDSYRKAFEKSL